MSGSVPSEPTLPPTPSSDVTAPPPDGAIAIGLMTPPPEVRGYQVTGRLGEGGMGVVWKAVQLSTHRTVALKVMSAGTLGSTKARHRFHREVELAASLEHPHIARVYDSGLEQGLCYYAMEFVPGINLRDYVRGQALGPRQIVELFLPICRAVQHAHQHGVIHRDLKPSNILVTAEGRPAVLDFGLAKDLTDNTEATVDVTGVDNISGTVAYMAPEQAAGKMALADTRSDVYSLGKILFEILTGQPAHDLSGGTMDVLQRIATEDVRRPRKVDPRLDRELEAILLKALDREPAARYASAGALAQDLENYLHGEPLAARRATTLYFLRKRLSKYRVPATVAAVVIATLAGTGVYAYLNVVAARDRAQVQWHRAEAASRLAETQRQRAEQGERSATQAAAQARAAAHQAHEQLLASYRARGWRLYEDGDPAGALLWYTEALRLAQADPAGVPLDPARERIQRIRLAHLTRAVPRLEGYFVHDSDITHAAFSSDGTRVVTASADTTAAVWDVATGLPVVPPLEHGSGHAVNHAEFSPDGTELATMASTFAHIWDLSSGKQKFSPIRLSAPGHSVHFSPNGRRLLVVGARDDTRFWDPGSGTPLSEPLGLSGKLLYDVATTPDRRVVAIVRGGVDVVDLATGKLTSCPLEAGWDETNVTIAALSANGRRLAMGKRVQGTVRVGEVQSSSAPSQEIHHGAYVQDMAANSTATRVVTCGRDRSAKVWDAADARMLLTLPHGGPVNQAVFSADGKSLLTASDDGFAQLWQVSNGSQRPGRFRHGGAVRQVSFDATGARVLSVGADRTARVWSMEPPEAPLFPRPVAGPMFHVYRPKFSPDGKQYAFGSAEPGLVVCDTSTGRALLTPTTPLLAEVRRCAYSPDGQRLVTVGNKAIHVVDATTGERLLSFPSDDISSNTFAEYSPDGQRILTIGYLALRIWDARTGEPVSGPIQARGIRVYAFSPDSRYVAGGDLGGGVRIWDVASGVPTIPLIKTEPDLLQRISRCIAFSPDGQTLLTAAYRSVRFWDPRTGQPRGSVLAHSNDVLWAAYSPRGDRVVTASADRTAGIWNAADGTLIAPPLRHPGSVTSAAFSPDGMLVATACEDGSARLWDAGTGEPVARYQVSRVNPYGLAFSPDSHRLLTGGSDSAELRDLTPDPRPIDELLAFSRLLTASEIDAAGGTVSLSSQELRQLLKEYPIPTPTTRPTTTSRPSSH